MRDSQDRWVHALDSSNAMSFFDLRKLVMKKKYDVAIISDGIKILSMVYTRPRTTRSTPLFRSTLPRLFED